MRFIIVAAPDFKGRNEGYISNHVFSQITYTEKIWIEGSYSGKRPPVKVEKGAFYDDKIWLAYQNSCIKKLLDLDFKDNDVIFFCDFWFMGLDLIKYKVETCGAKNVRLVGYLHGASFVDGDLMTYKWVPNQEKAWLEMYDYIFAASKFFVKNIGAYKKKLKIVGEPFDPRPYLKYEHDFLDKNIDVIWPHRLDPDKGVKELIQILRKLKPHNLRIEVHAPSIPNDDSVIKEISKYARVVTGVTGKEHYEALGKSKVVLSTAHQEGWGYSILKAATVGCHLVLPNRAVYPELYPKKFLYNSIDEAVSLILKSVKLSHTSTHVVNEYKIDLEKIFKN